MPTKMIENCTDVAAAAAAALKLNSKYRPCFNENGH